MSTLLTRRHRRRAHLPNSQAQSLLFSALPVELRLHIFGLVVVHGSPIPLAAEGPRNGLTLTLQTPGIGGPQVKALRATRLLSLPLTCARAHAEALPLLYGGNTFSVGDPAVVRLLAAGVGALLLRRFDISWTLSNPPSPPPTARSQQPKKSWTASLWRNWGHRGGKSSKEWREWTETWEALARLERLQWLRVELSVSPFWTSGWQEREAEILQPLKNVLREGAHGELNITWERDVQRLVAAEEMLNGWVVDRQVKGL
ncbi:hypothetical protein F4820DRAFT_14855 [Hypoxylon rubiginosum]|uniref:Uncharacterized protein n=1 Tax=Hypoxylon rubiginosum TaxID=110542 RepID=A0ACB9YUR0_9PEZI|nr:hypothetical protein F4820DRAFT_14855 [Hypoxylon rubiginosum]